MPINDKYCITANNISFSYNSSVVLENISFRVKEGDYLGVIGPNGGGKTTLVKIILGVIRPSSGEIKIYEKSAQSRSSKVLIGYVPQKISEIASHFPSTVQEVVVSGRTAKKGLFKNLNATDIKIAEKYMEIANISQLKSKRIDTLSGGEKQRVFIARALTSEPKILILDEPSVGVDILAQQKFYEFIGNLNKNFGLTIIFVSHDIDVIAKEVSSVLCLNKGLICHGSPKQFLTTENMQKLYGDKVRVIFHGHN